MSRDDIQKKRLHLAYKADAILRRARIKKQWDLNKQESDAFEAIHAEIDSLTSAMRGNNQGSVDQKKRGRPLMNAVPSASVTTNIDKALADLLHSEAILLNLDSTAEWIRVHILIGHVFVGWAMHTNWLYDKDEILILMLSHLDDILKDWRKIESEYEDAAVH